MLIVENYPMISEPETRVFNTMGGESFVQENEDVTAMTNVELLMKVNETSSRTNGGEKTRIS